MCPLFVVINPKLGVLYLILHILKIVCPPYDMINLKRSVHYIKLSISINQVCPLYDMIHQKLCIIVSPDESRGYFGFGTVTP